MGLSGPMSGGRSSVFRCDDDTGIDVVEVEIGPLDIEIPGWDPDLLDGVPGTVELVGRLYLPLFAGAAVAGPLIVFTHGASILGDTAYAAYSQILRCLASHGFPVLSVRSEAEFSNQILWRTRFLLAGLFEGVRILSEDYGIDLNATVGGAFAFIGHSQGGEAAARAALLARAGMVPDGVTASQVVAISLLPAKNDSEARTQTIDGYLVIGGTLDGDPGLLSAVANYDQLVSGFIPNSGCKALAVVDGMSHWLVADVTGGGKQAYADPSHVMSESTAQGLAAHYCLSFLAWRLLGLEIYAEWFTGTTQPVLPADLLGDDIDKVRVRMAFRSQAQPVMSPIPVGPEQQDPAEFDKPLFEGFTVYLAATDATLNLLPQSYNELVANAFQVDEGAWGHVETPAGGRYGWVAAVHWGVGAETRVWLPLRMPFGGRMTLVGGEPFKFAVCIDACTLLVNGAPRAAVPILAFLYRVSDNGTALVGSLGLLEVPAPWEDSGEIRQKSVMTTIVIDIHQLFPPLSPGDEIEVAGLVLNIGLGVDAGAIAFSAPRGMWLP
jgi:hypothetical protein